MKLETIVEEMEYQDPLQLYRSLTHDGSRTSLLLESRTIDPRYGRVNIIVPTVHFSLTGRDSFFELIPFTKGGEDFINSLFGGFFEQGYSIDFTSSGSYVGSIHPAQVISTLKESISDLKKASLAGIARLILDNIECNDEHAGLYGAFAYDFVRQFEYIGEKHIATGRDNDMHLFLPSQVIVIDEMAQKAKKITYVIGKEERSKEHTPHGLNDDIGLNDSFIHRNTLFPGNDMTDEEYISNAEAIVNEIKNGELIQAVLSRALNIELKRNPIDCYKELRTLNPSPYCFYYNLGFGEKLFGASPELHVKVVDGYVEIRPLAGTIRRPGDAVGDYNARLQLLTDEKERSEHTMLVDLARNDLGRVCKDVTVNELMEIETYPNLYHLGSQVRGQLREGIDALDCIAATLPAGTVSGAPKVAAMKLLEKMENSRRGYYGGCVGYVTANGNCNTGLTLRSVYVRDNMAQVRAGAGVVHHSIPENELKEVRLKMENQLSVIEGSK